LISPRSSIWLTRARPSQWGPCSTIPGPTSTCDRSASENASRPAVDRRSEASLTGPARTILGANRHPAFLTGIRGARPIDERLIFQDPHLYSAQFLTASRITYDSTRTDIAISCRRNGGWNEPTNTRDAGNPRAHSPWAAHGRGSVCFGPEAQTANNGTRKDNAARRYNPGYQAGRCSIALWIAAWNAASARASHDGSRLRQWRSRRGAHFRSPIASMS
jgi:hypothetical protein